MTAKRPDFLPPTWPAIHFDVPAGAVPGIWLPSGETGREPDYLTVLSPEEPRRAMCLTGPSRALVKYSRGGVDLAQAIAFLAAISIATNADDLRRFEGDPPDSAIDVLVEASLHHASLWFGQGFTVVVMEMPGRWMTALATTHNITDQSLSASWWIPQRDGSLTPQAR